MNDQREKRKDTWDKVDVLGKLVSGVILVLIAVILERGSDKISQSMQSGQLVQSLITDLAAPDTTIRQEIALAALNRVLWDRNPDLVWDVCERILSNSQYQNVTREYAFQIVLDRDSVRAKALLANRGSEALVRDTALDLAEGDTLSRVPDPVTQSLLSRYLDRVIYVQFHGRENRSIADSLRRHLIDEGFTSPGIERVDPSVNRVYYFHPQDSAVAELVARSVRSFFDERPNSNLSSRLEVEPLVGRYSAPEGQVEVWISPAASVEG